MPNAERFRNEAGLAKLAGDWPTGLLIEIWNSLPGATPVKKFNDRATAASRIWKAIQTLGQTVPEVVEQSEATAEPETAKETEPTVAHVAPQTLDVAPEEAPPANVVTRSKKAPKTVLRKQRARAARRKWYWRC
jgi:hypothetical protein